VRDMTCYIRGDFKMKKVKYLIFIFFLCILSIGVVKAADSNLNVKITNAYCVNKYSGEERANFNTSVAGLIISMDDAKFKDVGDYLDCTIEITNGTSELIEIDEEKITGQSDEYISYEFTSETGKEIPSNSSKSYKLLVSYNKEITEPRNLSNEIEIGLVDNGLISNPETGAFLSIFIIVIALVAALALIVIARKNRKIFRLGLIALLLIPYAVNARSTKTYKLEMKQNIRVFISDEAAGKKRAAELIDDIYGGGEGTGTGAGSGTGEGSGTGTGEGSGSGTGEGEGTGTGNNDVDKKSYLSGFVLGYDDGLEAANNRTDEDNEEYINAFKKEISDRGLADELSNFVDGYEDGYNSGYVDGKKYKDVLLDETSKAYKKGYEDGKKDGIKYFSELVIMDSSSYKQGYEDGIEYADSRTNTDSANYISGYNAGFAAGVAYEKSIVDKDSESYKAGYNDGHAQGVKDADDRTNTGSDSYKAGYEQGKKDADDRANPDSNNYKAGYNAGYNDGYNSGYNTGYSKGVSDADNRVNKNSKSYIEGHSKGVIDADARVNKSSKSYIQGLADGKISGASSARVGNAGAGQVLSGYTFTNSTSSGLKGTMVNQGSKNYSGTSNVTISAGYYNGSGHCNLGDAYSAGVTAGKETCGVCPSCPSCVIPTCDTTTPYNNGYKDGYNDGYKALGSYKVVDTHTKDDRGEPSGTYMGLMWSKVFQVKKGDIIVVNAKLRKDSGDTWISGFMIYEAKGPETTVKTRKDFKTYWARTEANNSSKTSYEKYLYDLTVNGSSKMCNQATNKNTDIGYCLGSDYSAGMGVDTYQGKRVALWNNIPGVLVAFDPVKQNDDDEAELDLAQFFVVQKDTYLIVQNKSWTGDGSEGNPRKARPWTLKVYRKS